MLVSKTHKLIEEVNELKSLCAEQITSEMMEGIDDKEFVLYVKMLRLINTSMDVIKEQSNMIDSIDGKLDRLLARKES